MIPIESINSIVEGLLKLSDDVFDGMMKELVQKWNSPPTALQILEVTDKCIYGSLTSNAVVCILQIMYRDTMERENTTHEEIEKLAVWRKELT